MPYLLRLFFKLVYDECKLKWKDEFDEKYFYSIVSDFLFGSWIKIAAFIDPELNGLIKDFNIGKNCKENIKLIGLVRLLKIITKFIGYVKVV